MRKTVCLVLALAMCLSLCACGNSQAVKDVEAQISAIGEISPDSGEAVSAAREAYNALTKKEQASVENYKRLKDAEAALKELRSLSERGNEAVECVKRMKALVDKPASFRLSDDIFVFETEDTGRRVCAVHYSAQDSSGVSAESTGIFVDGQYLSSLEELQEEVERIDNEGYSTYEERIDQLEKIIPMEEILVGYSGVKMLNEAWKAASESDFLTFEGEAGSGEGYEVVSAKSVGKVLNIPHYKEEAFQKDLGSIFTD